MRPVRFGVAFLAACLVWMLPPAVAQPLRKPPTPITPPQASSLSDEAALKSANLSPTGPAVVEFFRKRAQPKVERETLVALIGKLSEKDATIRDRAAADLVSYGPAAVPLLREAANDLDDADRGVRARACLQSIEGPSGTSLSIAAARILAATRPDDAAGALLDFLPYAEDDQTVEEVSRALEVVGYLKDGKPDPALLKAIKDEVPIRRAAAAEVLSRTAAPEDRSAVRQLLEDPKPSVRLRAAMALANARDADAVGVLIGLLGDVPAEQSAKIEEFLTDLAGDWNVKVPPANDEVARRIRKEVWAAWWKATDGPVLLEEFKKRSLPDAEREKVMTLIDQLADESVETREKALTALQARGGVVLPLLVQVSKGTGKYAEAAKKALPVLERDRLPPIPLVAARMVAVRKPAGSLDVLLAAVPFLDGDDLFSEVRTALTAVAVRDGKLEPALVKALADKLPERRALAAEAISQAASTAEQRAGVRALLTDKDLTVRMRAALAFAGAREKEAMPVLINLLADLQSEQAYQVEEFLQFVAGETAPNVVVGSDEESRKKARTAWTAWWRDNEGKVQLERLDSPTRLLGYTLIVEQYSPTKGTGRVFELDSAGKVRWEISGLQYPLDAQVTASDKVLIVEQNMQRVSERDLKGAILWQKTVPQQVLSAQRLRNGNTFIASRGQLIEVDKSGKEVWTHNQPNQDIIVAQKMRDGSVMFMNYNWQVTRLDATGKEVKSFRIPPSRFGINQNTVEFLPNDRVLIGHPNEHKVIEYDSNGKEVWTASVQFPYSVARLPNGRTLVGSVNRMMVMELDRSGKVVWEHKEANMRPFKVRKR